MSDDTKDQKRSVKKNSQPLHVDEKSQAVPKLSIAEVREKVRRLGLHTSSESAAMIRTDRDSR